jgi:hypothetical protein
MSDDKENKLVSAPKETSQPLDKNASLISRGLRDILELQPDPTSAEAPRRTRDWNTPTMMLNVGDWWTEPSYTMPFATNMKCFNLVCDIQNISKHEDYFGKKHCVYHRTKITGELQNVGDAMFLESPPEFTLPVCIGPSSHLGPLVFELSWPFPGEKTDEACLREIFDDVYEVLIRDETFGTIIMLSRD